MKKFISIVLSAVLLLSLTCVLSGCGTDAKKIIGTWTADVDYTDAFNFGLHSAEGMEEMGEHFKAKEFILTTTITFRDDGTYTIAIDEASAEKAMESIEYILYDGFVSILTEQYNQQFLPISLEKYLEGMRNTIWSMVDSALTDEVKKELLDGLVNPHTGNYKLEDGKLYMTKEVTDDFGEDHDTYELDGDTLTLLECFCQIDEEQAELQRALYPMIFTRITEE